MKKIKKAAPAAENTVALNTEIQDDIKDFAEDNEIPIAASDRKMIQTFFNRSIDELNNLYRKWGREIMKVSKKAETQDKTFLQNFLFSSLVQFEFGEWIKNAEFLAAIGFFPKETVQAMKEAF